MTGIYKITNLDNGKMYVGQAIDIKNRWSQHKSNLRHNNHENLYLQNSWNLHGEDVFEFDVIEECNPEELDDKEKYWISNLRTYIGFDDCNGYNMTLGGKGTLYIHNVLQFDLNGNFIKEWESPRQASMELNISIQAIIYSCSKSQKYGYGYIWMYKEDYTGLDSLDWYLSRSDKRQILQYDKDANLINMYDSLASANKILGYKVNSCVSGKCATSHGYIFVYKNSDIEINKEYCNWAFSLRNNTCNKPFYKLDKEGNIIKRYNTLREAEEDGYHETMVNDCLRGLRSKYKEHIWAYEDNIDLYTKSYCNELYNHKEQSYRGVGILQYKDDRLISRYNNLSSLPSEFSKSNVSECCKNRKVQYKGYTWKYDLNE